MGIRGDMEARYWAEMGHEKPREMANWFFDCLKEPDTFLALQREFNLSDAELCRYFEWIDWLRENVVTKAAADG